MSSRIRFWFPSGGLALVLSALATACQGSPPRSSAEVALAEESACRSAQGEAGASPLICEEEVAPPAPLAFTAPRPRPPEDPASTPPAASSPISRQPLRGGGR